MTADEMHMLADAIAERVEGALMKVVKAYAEHPSLKENTEALSANAKASHRLAEAINDYIEAEFHGVK